MIKKSLLATLMIGMMCAFATPAQAQFKKLGKSLGKAAESAGKAVQDTATDMVVEKGANTASDKIVEFMDNNNTVAINDDNYVVRLKTIMGSGFTQADGKALDIKVYENDEANVITLNNGSIRIYSGMLDLLSDDEVKGLLALQIGHIQSKNVRDNLLKTISGDNAEDASSAQIEKMLSFSGDQLGSIINELLQMPYTAEQNKKADKAAKDYLKSEKIDLEGYNSLLSKIVSLSQIDLENEDQDQEAEDFQQATVAAKFINANKLR